mgnify:CR=1 FL=1
MSDATFLEYVVFFSAAVMILGGAIGVITMKNPVHAALGLVLTLFGVAVQFVAMDAQFLAAVQVIVYAPAPSTSAWPTRIAAAPPPPGRIPTPSGPR